MFVLAAGCGKTSETVGEPVSSAVTEKETVSQNAEESDTSVAEQTGLHFKTGTWATSDGTNYVFYENGRDGQSVDVAEGIALGFEYELNADGSGVFHMGSVDDVTEVTVEFTDGENTAVINRKDGYRSVLKFVSEDISDDFSYNYTMKQITEENSESD